MARAVMHFAWPPGLWLGVAGAAVLLAYFVRRRARLREVAFLNLWTAVQARRRGGWGLALTRMLDLVAVLLACAALALAAGLPFLPGRPSTVRDLVLVLDGGIELAAGGRAERLRKVAEAEIRRRAEGTHMVVVRVGEHGAGVWAGRDPAAALRAVADHTPGWLPARWEPSADLAREASRGLRDPDLVFCTYRPAAPEGFRLRTVVEPVANAGIASLEVVADPEGSGRLARLGIRGEGFVRVAGQWEGEIAGERSVDVALPPEGEVVLRVEATEDGFAYDDAAYLVLPARMLPRVLVVATGDVSAFLAAALSALASTEAIDPGVGRTTPDHAAEASRTFDVVVWDRCAPPAPLSGARGLYLAPPAGALPFKVGPERPATAIFAVAADHPLLSGVDLERVPPRTARTILGGESLARTSAGPVLAASPGWIALGFDPEASLLAASPAYPLFLRNCVAFLAGTLPVRTAEFRAVGEPAPVEGVAAIDGLGSRRVDGVLLGPPGFWRLGDVTIGVSLLRRDLDLRAAAATARPLPSVGAPATPDRPLAAAFGGAALALLLVAWWLYWRVAGGPARSSPGWSARTDEGTMAP